MLLYECEEASKQILDRLFDSIGLRRTPICEIDNQGVSIVDIFVKKVEGVTNK